MAEYKCFTCDKKISPDQLRKKVRCLYCGSKILYKARTVAKKIKAR
ncbi:MAG TPA: DNA-directed RNA polymerase subunit P [Candidatus Nanoarchaeia archaeon]|nr:DNA-directed RNA polymerase subunit P [Candidatus Nanoarchaeia archaeon]